MQIPFKKIKKYLFTGIATLGFIILYAGLGFRGRASRGGQFNLYMVIIGSLILLPFALHFLYDYFKTKKQEKDKKEALKLFKKEAIQIKVDLTTIKVLSNSWSEEIIDDDYVDFFIDPYKKASFLKKSLNKISIEIPYKEKIFRYHCSNTMDAEILRMHFAIQKETTFYIQKTNNKNTYLDLEFLE